MDSRDSLNQTPDSIDLTESPVKHTNTQKHIEKINEDTSDDDIDEMIKLEQFIEKIPMNKEKGQRL